MGRGLGGSQLAVIGRLFIVTKAGSGAQGGAVLVCFQVSSMLETELQDQGRTLKTHFMGLSKMPFTCSAHDFQAVLSSDHVGGGSRVLLQTLPTALTGRGDSTRHCLDDPMLVQGGGGSFNR